ncbi:MAG TPA: DUF4912 domain-containing protein [Bacillota bacterium]|nr:DUF4912 domain-containing protein [Bacillota bacterium]
MLYADNLPPGYDENGLVLLMQSPNVLFAYWNLSAGRREALAGKGKLLLGLNAKHDGQRRLYEIKPQWDSFYFTDVEAGREYYCDISIVCNGFEYPLMYSNKIRTPVRSAERKNAAGSPGFWGAGETAGAGGKWKSASSEVFYG